MTSTLPDIHVKRQVTSPPPPQEQPTALVVVPADEEPDTSADALAALRERLPPIRPPSPLVRRHRPAPPVVSVATLNARAPRTVPLPASLTHVLKRIEKDETNARAILEADEQLHWTHASIEWLRVVCNEMEGTVVYRETSCRDTLKREEGREWALLQQDFEVRGTRISQRIIQGCARQMAVLVVDMMDVRKDEQASEALERTVLQRRELIYRPVQQDGAVVVTANKTSTTNNNKSLNDTDGSTSPHKAALARTPKRPPSADRNFAENGRKRWGDEKQYRQTLGRYDVAVQDLDPLEQLRREEILGVEMTAWLKIQRDALKESHGIERKIAARGFSQPREEEDLSDEAHSATAEAVVGHALSCALVVSGQEQERTQKKENDNKKEAVVTPQPPAGRKRRLSDVTVTEPPASTSSRRSSRSVSPALPPAVPVLTQSGSALDTLFFAQGASAGGAHGLDTLALATSRAPLAPTRRTSLTPAATPTPTQQAAPTTSVPQPSAAKSTTTTAPAKPPSPAPSKSKEVATTAPVAPVVEAEPQQQSFAFPTLNILCDVLLDQRETDPQVVQRWLPLLESAVEKSAEEIKRETKKNSNETNQNATHPEGAEFFYRLLTAETCGATKDHVENVIWRLDRHHHGVQFAIELMPTRWTNYESKEELEGEEQLEMVYRELLTREKRIQEQVKELWEMVDGHRAVGVAKTSPKKQQRSN